MKKTISLKMSFAFPGKKKAQTALKALEPDLLGKHEKRAQTKASIKKNILAFSVNAEDLGALKASMQSCAKSTALAQELFNGGFG